MLPYDGPLLHAFIHVPSNAANILPHLIYLHQKVMFCLSLPAKCT